MIANQPMFVYAPPCQDRLACRTYDYGHFRVWQGVGELKPSKLLYQRLETIMSVGSVIDRSNYYPISDDDILSP